MRRLPVSATYRFPAVSSARPCGCEKPVSCAVCLPAALKISTTLSEASETMTDAPPLALISLLTKAAAEMFECSSRTPGRRTLVLAETWWPTDVLCAPELTGGAPAPFEQPARSARAMVRLKTYSSRDGIGIK